MFKTRLLTLLVAVGVLSACTEDPGITMKFNDNDETLMMGKLTMNDVNFVNKVYFDYEVTDGETVCSGKTPTVKLQLTSALENKVNTTMSVECNDGRNGKLAANMTFSNKWSGVGVGKLSDGTKVRVIVGDVKVVLSGKEMKQLALILSFTLGLTTAAQAGFENGNNLYDFCQDTDTNWKKPICTGYITAISDMLEIGPPFISMQACIPNITRQQLIDVVIAYLRDNPARRHYLASGEVTYALLQAFPCR